MGDFNDIHFVDHFSHWGWVVMPLACLVAGWIAAWSVLAVKKNNAGLTLFRCDKCAAGVAVKETVFIYAHISGKSRAFTLCRECFDAQPCAVWSQPDAGASQPK